MKTRQFALIAVQMTVLMVLAACGGGGGGMVRSDPPATPPVTVVPPLPLGEPCPPPIVGICYVQPPSTLTWDEYGMTGGRESDFKLIVGTGGIVNLKQGVYRFSGGTEIGGGTLVVWDTLVSDVKVLHDYTGLGFEGTSVLWLSGTVRGNVTNEEIVTLRHRCGTALNVCVEDRRSRIEGNYLQGDTGILEVVLGWELQITGTAMLGGRVRFIRGTSQSYVLPTAPSSILVLQAAGGLSGQFYDWSGDGLFLTGALRYTGNEVYFDATRISLASAMAAAGGASKITLASAAHLDSAFERADRYALAPRESLTPSQLSFLNSAAAIQHIGDVAQGERSLYSLSGLGHSLLADAMQEQTAGFTSQLDARLAALNPEAGSSLWSEPISQQRGWSGRHGLSGGVSGTDHWLDRQWLIGASIGGGYSRAQFDRTAGAVNGRAAIGGLYAHFRGDRVNATVTAGAARADLQVQRLIDLGDGGHHPAFTRRVIDQTFVHGEVARGMRVGAGWLTPYLALDFVTLRSPAFIEHGVTGFEFVSQPMHGERITLATGARYAQEWDVGRNVMAVALDAKYQRHTALHGDSLRAAFIGTADTDFEVAGWERQRTAGSWGLSLAGGLDSGWVWTADYRQEFGQHERGTGWSVALKRPF